MAPFLSSLRNLKKRSKEKRDPPSSSSQPASQSPSGALIPNLIPSAPDSLSIADPAVTTPYNIANQHGNTSSHHSVAKATTLNVFKLTLTALASVSDNIPVPGLKPAMEGLLSVIEKVQVRL
jgi:hypothetical protein